MASNHAENEMIDSKEFFNELPNVTINVTTEEGQLVEGHPHTLTTDVIASVESYIATEQQPIHVENNSSIIIIIASGKELANTLNIAIAKNFGFIILGENIDLNVNVRSREAEAIEELDGKIQGNKVIPPNQPQPLLDGKQLDSGQTNKSVKDGLTSRSEFCQTSVLAPTHQF